MTATLTDYRSFIARKRVAAVPSGFRVEPDWMQDRLFPWQRDIVRWACRLGRAAIFADCGLGKTLMQLEWADWVHQVTGGNVIILCPLAVAWQTLVEAARFGIHSPVAIAADQTHVRPGITITNYEKLHLFDASSFAGVVLDESSILKSFTGTTKQALCDGFARTPYRLCCTATPAPNDRMELGNHADFLGVMPSSEMLARWFINDTMGAGKYRLRKHGERDFWRWVSSWAVCIGSPSDLGYPNEGFTLPPLSIHEHVIANDSPPAGHLFHPGGSVSATNVHTEKRASLPEKAGMVASLVNSNADAWAVWCDTDYEADALCSRIPDAVEVRGSHGDRMKEDRLQAFSRGDCRVIVTKPEIGGYGLNWQHCHKTTWFASYSYEDFYQAIRRLWRFGQRHAVDAHVIMSEAEESIAKTSARKSAEHEEMKAEMSACMKEGMLESLYERRVLKPYRPTQAATLPAWLNSRI